MDGLKEVYETYQKKLAYYDEFKTKLEETRKPLVIFEGESDRIFFKKAIKKILPTLSNILEFSKEADKKNNGVVGEGAPSIYGFVTSHLPKSLSDDKCLIAILDNDAEGVMQFRLIKDKFKSFYESKNLKGIEVLKHKKYKAYVFCLVPPEFRKEFVCERQDSCYLSTEMLLQDGDIPIENRDFVPHTTPQLFSFKSNKKVNFANNVSPDSDFSGFVPTINMIKEILNIEGISVN